MCSVVYAADAVAGNPLDSVTEYGIAGVTLAASWLAVWILWKRLTKQQDEWAATMRELVTELKDRSCIKRMSKDELEHEMKAREALRILGDEESVKPLRQGSV
jgi:hypothetical protein